MDKKLLDPYGLLGVTSRSSINELKKNYYNLALLCHPDKGGSEKDMNIVSLAYNYVKNQLENIKEVTYEQLESEFDNFCKGQEALKPPTFGQIYEETNDWINDFNKEFEKKLNTSGEMRQFIGSEDDIYSNPYLRENNPMNDGYGDYMEVSSYHNTDPEYDLANDLSDHIYDTATNTEDNYIETYNPTETNRVKNEFENIVVIYDEPESLPNTVTHYPVDNETINDYSGKTDSILMSDYKKAFSLNEKLPDIDETDYPIYEEAT